MIFLFLDKKGYSVKCKHRMRDSVTNRVGKLQFVIGPLLLIFHY